MNVDQIRLLSRRGNADLTLKVLSKDWDTDRMYAFYLVQCGHTITWTDPAQQIEASYKQSVKTNAVATSIASKPTMATRVMASVRSMSNTRSKR